MKNIDLKLKRLLSWVTKNVDFLHDVKDCSKSNNPLVTIQCLTYNHEKYLRQCLDSFLMQKVNFDVEIIIHDDCSSDTTKEIIEEYKKKYPNVIKSVYEKENICSSSNNFLIAAKEMTLISRGKYISLCDGDDFWTDPFKLIIQASLMEMFPKASFCCHKVEVYNEKKQIKEGFLPKTTIPSSLLSKNKFIKTISKTYSFQTGSYFFKTSDYKELFLDMPDFALEMPTDDEAQLRYFGSKGPSIFINRTMSLYRHFSVNSWSDKKNQFYEREKKYKQFCFAINLFDKFTKNKYHKSCLIATYRPVIFELIKRKEYSTILKDRNLRIALRSFGLKFYFKILFKSIMKQTS